jgi:pimeloyl-ACP methyl ester carboxylesterase
MAPLSTPLLRLAALAALLVAASACSGGDDEEALAPTSTAAAQASPTVMPAEPTATPTPDGASLPGVSDEAVAFEAEDGVVIRGHLYSQPGPARTAVIFAHMFPADQTSWTATAQRLTAAGVATMTFDFRGYGESEGEVDVPNIDKDLRAALYFLEARDFTEIYLVGASMGGTASLRIAATEAVAGVIAVSAPVEVPGINTQDDLAQITVPKLFIASSGDAPAAAAYEYFLAVAAEPKQSELFDGNAHGTELLATEHAEAVEQLIADFVSG